MVVPTMLARIVACCDTGADVAGLRTLSYGGGKHAGSRDREGTPAVPRRGLRQRLRAHRDELDHRRART